MHTEIPIKVTAWVDKGIAPLVEALNEIKGLRTLESCQDGGSVMGAYVFFTYGVTWRELVEMVQSLADGLSENEGRFGQKISLEWLGTNERPRALLSVEPKHVTALANVIRGLAANFVPISPKVSGNEVSERTPCSTARDESTGTDGEPGSAAHKDGIMGVHASQDEGSS